MNVPTLRSFVLNGAVEVRNSGQVEVSLSVLVLTDGEVLSFSSGLEDDFVQDVLLLLWIVHSHLVGS
jgi:hypothetical protein